MDWGSFEYLLQRIPVGIVVLDRDRRILSANPTALRLLARDGKAVVGEDILSLHPETARAKVGWLLDTARDAQDGEASLVVTTPMGSLVAKVTRLSDGGAEERTGYCMMFHALGAARMGDPPPALPSASPSARIKDGPRYLLKVPLTRGKGGVTTLIDADQVVCLTAQGHYAEARTLQAAAFCPRSLADLERRLDPGQFLRIHRRHLVNIRHVLAAERSDGQWSLLLADPAATRIPVSREKVEMVRRLLAV